MGDIGPKPKEKKGLIRLRGQLENCFGQLHPNDPIFTEGGRFESGEGALGMIFVIENANRLKTCYARKEIESDAIIEKLTS